MMFCGSRVNAMSVDGGVLKNECFVDILNIIPHGVLLLVAIPVLIVLNKSSFGCMEVSAWVHFRGHSTRWLLTLLMILILAVELGEGLIADSLDPDSVNLHVILPSSLSIIGMIASITYYHNIEQWNVPKFLLMLMMYWTAMVILKSLKGVSLLLNHASHIHLRLWITWIGVIVYASLLLLEIYVLKKQRYAFYKKRVKLSPPDEMGISPYVHHHVNFLSKVTFWWVNDFLRKGFKRPLEQEDLGQIPWRDQAFVQYGKLSDSFFNEKFKAEQAGKKVSFHRAYFKAFWKMLALAGALRFIADTLAFIGPWSIEYIVEFAYKLKNNTGSHSNTMQNGVAENVTLRYDVNQSFSDLNITGSQQDSGVGVYVTVVDFFSNGYVLCFCLFLATLLQHTLLQNHHYLCIREGIRLKIAVQALVYSKALKLSTAVITSGEMAMGQIINLMSSDANFMMNLFFFIHFIWSAPYQTILALVLMYYKLGWSAVVGGSVVILAGPINYFLGKVMSKMQKKTMQKADARVKKCNEAIQGIKVIKLLSWESHFMSNIISSRKEELKFIFHAACMRVFMSFISVCVPILGTMVAFLVHTYLEEDPFSVGTALSTLALFNIIQVPSTLFGMFIVTMVTARVSASRLLKFFLSLEVEKVELRTPRLIHQDTDLSLKSHHALEMNIFEMRNGGKVSKATDTKEEDQLSLSSMGSYYSRTPGHSRRGSHASLLDAQDSLGSLRGTMSRKHSSSALTVEGEGRRRHASGISSEDDDDAVNEICITIEPITVMEMTNGNFAWEKDKEPILRDINVVIPEGKLTLIVGQVGSGKSSLLAAALGEMITTSGRVEWKCGTTKALVSQKPWLLNATLKDNILFGQSFHWKRYARIIKACSLQQDIDILPSGDMTEIGEKGINLSGGQKQRVCIARALYSKANTFLMDDPLSSLDAHVGKHVFEEAILHRLLKRKRTVVLVTHQLQYISYAHHIIVMHEGQVKYQGKLADVKKIDPDLYESWRQALKDSKVSQHTDSGEGKESLPEIIDTADLSKSSPSKVATPGDGAKTEGATARRISSQSHCHSLARLSNKLADFEEETISQAGKEGENEDQEVPEKGSQSPSGHENEKPEEAKGKLIKKEHRESGSVALRVYWSYVQACFVPLVTLTLLTFLLYNGLLIGCNVVLSLWSAASSQFLEQQALVQYNVTQVKDFDNLGYIQQYIILNVSGIGTALFAWAMLHLSGLMGSRHLHNNMLNSVLHMRLRFFDTNPTGRIMNRFSADLSQIDQKLPTILENLLRCLLLTLSGLVVNCLATPYFLLAAFPLMLLYYCMQVFYRATARELQRIDSITKSPVYSHFSETVNGLQTIRAYGVEKQFKIKALSTINDNTAPLLYLHTINRWLGIRLDYLGAFLVLVAGVSSLAACGSGSSSPAYVGLSITYALLISFYLNWIVRNSAETEMIMNAVERVYEYSHMETESSAKRQGSEAKYSSWPQNGKIEFRNVSIKYDENLDDVVKNVTFTFNSGEKIGICGRTGSGKSSLVLSIFRMIPVSQGHIFIDERDTSMIPLHELRSRLAIIPQDPVLFTGTIRYNLCPDGGISDQDIWSALETVQLKDTIAALPDKLDSHVSEGGENFSIGQKQLFCLARAFLRDNKILVLDEATASIDLETDNKLQSVIFSAFQDKTVITIAHRISTIMKYNKVMVMHEGTVKEFDSPQTLLRDSSSMFHALVHAVKSSS